ncbi:Chalcone--flavanone isomerase [Trichinella spiralis]|uniref:Chalcone--flavanone isomerase n=1 Tax=Trichinella spiralis TaxID=6334 RepID=A0ABR3K387_TRISP
MENTHKSEAEYKTAKRLKLIKGVARQAAHVRLSAFGLNGGSSASGSINVEQSESVVVVTRGRKAVAGFMWSLACCIADWSVGRLVS